MKKGTKTTGWTPKRRAEQSLRMKKTKPWQNSTGPKTDAGKDAVRNNAYKHGFRSADYREILRLLSLQAAFVKSLLSRNPSLSSFGLIEGFQKNQPDPAIKLQDDRMEKNSPKSLNHDRVGP